MSYAITPEQRATLDRFSCRRLTEIENRNMLIADFASEKGGALVDALKNRGWVNDLKGSIAYYLVTDPDGQAVFYFSLRCGLLCEPNYVNRILGLLDETIRLMEALNSAEQGDAEAIAFLKAEKLRLGRTEYERRLDNLQDLHSSKLDILRDVKEDKRTVPDQDVVRVDETHAAVELVEMCVNDNARESWAKWNLGTGRMGETLFWHFMIGKVLEMSRIVGCEYAYYFAAGTREGSLVKYYHEHLHFIEPKRLSTIKPSYDKNCVLMCKKIFTGKPGIPGPMGLMEYDPDYRGLDKHREAFYANFNKPVEP